MNAKLPGFIGLIRRDIVREYPTTLDELARPAPCDGCKLRQRCAAERLACMAFVAFVHREDRNAWRTFARRDPSREMYDRAMSTEGEAQRVEVCERAPRESAAVRAERWIGQSVGTREVVGVERTAHGGMLLRLHCAKCGRVAGAKLSRIASGKTTVCVCERAAVWRTDRNPDVDARMGDPEMWKPWAPCAP